MNEESPYCLDFSRHPALKLLLLVICGLLIGILTPLHTINPLLLMLIVLIFSIVVYLTSKRKEIPYLLLSLTIGFVLSNEIDTLSFETPSKIIPEQKFYFHGTITNIIKSDSITTRCIVRGELDAESLPKMSSSSMMLNISGLISLPEGSLVRVYGKLRPPKQVLLATDFDEKLYLAGLDIQWVARAKANNVTCRELPNNLHSLRYRSKSFITKIIESTFAQNTAAYAKALLLGDKSDLSSETKRIYSLSGTSHILALSGLHIGIISFVLFTLLNFIPNQAIKFVIFSIAIMSFVFLTGMLPSALRAALMAILFVFARTIEKESSGLNILSFVVLISIVFDPSMILSAGFQMSVGAILGITIFYPRVKSFLQSFVSLNIRAYDYISSSLAMTISASLIVSPLVAIYFDTFSIVSILSNFFVIPLMSLALIYALLTVLTSFIPSIAALFAISTEFLIYLSEKINELSIKLPFAYLEGFLAIAFSFLSLLAVVYIINARSGRLTIFRMLVATFVISASLIIFQERPKQKSVYLVPRDFSVALFAEKNNRIKYVYISDRKPSLPPIEDYALLNQLNQTPDQFVLFVNGNIGINLADKLRETKQFKYIELKENEQKRLEYVLNLPKRISKINQKIEL